MRKVFLLTLLLIRLSCVYVVCQNETNDTIAEYPEEPEFPKEELLSGFKEALYHFSKTVEALRIPARALIKWGIYFITWIFCKMGAIEEPVILEEQTLGFTSAILVYGPLASLIFKALRKHIIWLVLALIGSFVAVFAPELFGWMW